MLFRITAERLRKIYTVLFYLLLPAILLRLFYLGFRNPGYRQRWTERLGYALPMSQDRPRLWVHAVSVGEVQAATPMIEAIKREYPKLDIVITTTTPTGADNVARLLAGHVTHLYTPYDLPTMISRFFRRIRPRLLILMEIELWPNLLHLAGESQIPVILVNARLSERSVGNYRRLFGLTSEMLSKIAFIAAQSQADAERLIALGADPIKVAVTGNLKFDAKPSSNIREQARQLRSLWGENRPVWIAASTHEGEEAGVLDAHQRLLENQPDTLLLLAPRHPERFQRIYDLCRQRELQTQRRSAGLPPGPQTQVFLIDTMGELPLFYGASDLAFVGGSLAEIGGHNPLEPASLGIPILTGPHIFNFKEIFRLLMEAGAVRRIETSEQLAAGVLNLLNHPEFRYASGAQALRVVEAHRGATESLMKLLRPYLPSNCNQDGQYAASS